ncbi:TonB-dependent receptor family protein [Tenacibaculum sp. SG-28]|uniref:TonB-dependent receptor family protein n=1 Tax=Tenacibaculum sp. SG-28 TaxID=754426 RepID=UPI0026CF4543
MNASRKAVGIRTRRADVSDVGGVRELLIGDFNNFGFEFRFLDSYNFFDKKATYLLGTKFYKADNNSIQGPGSANSDADFTLRTEEFPNYKNQSDFSNPNLNIAFFGENIFYLSDKLSITPGFRVEYIKTGSKGFKKTVNTDGAGNPIGEIEEFDDISKERMFVLFGVGMEYKWNSNIEMYGNISQNYRSITFSDVNIVNPSNAIDENLKDETGFTADIGIRGNYKRLVSYDIGAFALFYNDKIDFLSTTIPPVNYAGLLRTNIGDSRVYGIESLLDFNLQRILDINPNYAFNYFVNSSFIKTEYTRAIAPGIKGNKMPFVPDVNLKTGIKFGYKNFSSSMQYTYLSLQYTDASNSIGGGVSGVIGEIPAYDVFDFSSSYKFKLFKIEAGVNNLLDENYFTRRATGYPGPGIIPSAPRTYYVTVEFKI